VLAATTDTSATCGLSILPEAEEHIQGQTHQAQHGQSRKGHTQVSNEQQAKSKPRYNNLPSALFAPLRPLREEVGEKFYLPLRSPEPARAGMVCVRSNKQ